MMEHREDDVKAERSAWFALEWYAKGIAKDCKLIAGAGNGNCGAILDTVINHLRNAGMYTTPSAQKSNKKPISSSLRKQVFERDAYRCVKCGDHHDLEADHIHPESLGGKATLENLQTLCKPCNMKKSNRVVK